MQNKSNPSKPGRVLHGRSPSLGTHRDEGVVSTCFCNKLERRLSLAGVNGNEELFKILVEKTIFNFDLAELNAHLSWQKPITHTHFCNKLKRFDGFQGFDRVDLL